MVHEFQQHFFTHFSLATGNIQSRRRVGLDNVLEVGYENTEVKAMGVFINKFTFPKFRDVI